MNGKDISDLPTRARNIGLLFQDAVLFPHLSVGQNLAFALPAHVRGRSQRQARVDDALASAGLTGFAPRDPATLSGGQKARVALLRTPTGFGFAPLAGDAVMPPGEYQHLPPAQRKPIEDAMAELQQELEAVIEQIPQWRREAQRQLRELDRQVTQQVVGSLIAEIRETWEAIAAVRDHLEAVRNDVLDHVEAFQMPRDGDNPALLAVAMARGEPAEALCARYSVNVLVHHADGSGAPVVCEDHPTHDNLVGRIEHESQMGMMITDFTLIRSGALHRANGGYLVIDALRLLAQPLAWEALKRAMRAGEIRTESLAQALFSPEAWYRAIHVGTELAGFVMLYDESLRSPAPERPRIAVWRFMIDAAFQGRGIGRSALLLVIEHVRAKGVCSRLELSYVPGPRSPENFYRGLGFKPNGKVDEG
jgi:GNAT superfamily N-acetyltransferase